ncbi:MAG: hypothetical protein K0S29_1047, partial [Gammaproteobacteria bacterium]|nr:hypothetical protein [Gammaproteobacteria bacterium]
QLLVIANWVVLAWLLHYNTLFYIIIMLCSALFVHQHVLITAKQAYIKAFSDNHWLGLLIWLGILFQYL